MTSRRKWLNRYQELEVAQRWWSLPHGSPLPVSNGATYILLFPGLPGGAAGPDVRDAVFAVAYRPLLAAVQLQGLPLPQIVGDVEFHIRAIDWFIHGHQRDVRYNNVVLHAVFSFESRQPTVRQDSVVVPVCCLHDIVIPGNWPLPTPKPQREDWPCHSVMQNLEAEEVTKVLQLAGKLRFEQKVTVFVEEVHEQMGLFSEQRFSAYDRCLIVALAEGLGYGRDRQFFRAAGLSLINNQSDLPEPLGNAAQPAPLDARRLRSLGRLIASWHSVGVWETCKSPLLSEDDQTDNQRQQALRKIFCDLGLSVARTDILLCNVIFPFATAIGLIEHNAVLCERALGLYQAHPGLSANRVTRLMCKQLNLSVLPQGSCQQQGLQYIHQQTCREKQCAHCIVGRREI